MKELQPFYCNAQHNCFVFTDRWPPVKSEELKSLVREMIAREPKERATANNLLKSNGVIEKKANEYKINLHHGNTCVAPRNVSRALLFPFVFFR